MKRFLLLAFLVGTFGQFASAQLILRQSTQVDIRVGPFVAVGDGFTPQTGCDESVADEAELLKAAGAATVSLAAATLDAITGSDGWCDLTMTTSFTDTVGEFVVVFQDDSIYLPVFVRGFIVEEDTYDFLYASGATPDTDIAAILTDTGTTLDDLVDDLESRVGTPSDLGGGATVAANLSDIEGQTDDIGAAGAGLTALPAVSSNVTQINSSAAAAARLALSSGVIIPGTIDNSAHTPTTTEFEADDVTEATADHYIGRIVIFTSGALLGQAATITDYSLVGSNGHFTVSAMTDAPANNDSFIIL